MSDPDAQPLISVVIPNYNGAPFISACLASLLQQTYNKYELFVVDNASQDASLEVIERVAPQACVLQQNHNLGFAGGVNAGIRRARGDWIAILNNDTEVAPDWLEQCANAIAEHPEAAFLACRILDFTRREHIYSAGDCFLRAGIGYRRGQERRDCETYQRDSEIFSACGCAAVFRRSVLVEAGGYDENFFAYFEDVDLGLRLCATGHRGRYISGAVVYHRGGSTSGGEFSQIAVRLRTRNSLLLLLKNLPGEALWRWSPMILAAQISWLARVVMHWRLASYLRGLVSVFPMVPAMFEARRNMRRLGRQASRRLQDAVLEAESMARGDFTSSEAEWPSTFLRWYFRLF